MRDRAAASETLAKNGSQASPLNGVVEPLLLGSKPIYDQGNIRIADGKLRMGNESLPLANIVAATRRRVGRPRRHWMTIMIVAVLVILTGLRFVQSKWGLPIVFAGALLGACDWLFHRQRAWLVQLNLLLNQRLSVQFERLEDADDFLAALQASKGGELPVRITK